MAATQVKPNDKICGNLWFNMPSWIFISVPWIIDGKNAYNLFDRRTKCAVVRPLVRVRILILFILFVRIFPHFRQQSTSEAASALTHKHTHTHIATRIFRVTYRVRGLLTITTSSGAMSLSMCMHWICVCLNASSIVNTWKHSFNVLHCAHFRCCTYKYTLDVFEFAVRMHFMSLLFALHVWAMLQMRKFWLLLFH